MREPKKQLNMMSHIVNSTQLERILNSLEHFFSVNPVPNIFFTPEFSPSCTIEQVAAFLLVAKIFHLDFNSSGYTCSQLLQPKQAGV